jgi:uncharacterized membrane protein
MGGWWPMMGGGWLSQVLGLTAFILFLLILVALFRWLWKKGNQGSK